MDDGRQKLRREGAGLTMDVFFFGFVLWIMEEAIRLGIGRLYFFTREGEFFQALYGEVKKHNPFGCRLPEAEIVEVSRMSTFMPSLREISIAEFMRIWNQYPVQAVGALFKSLHMEGYGLEQYLDKYGIQKEEAIQCPWKDQRIQQLFQDHGFIDAVREERDRRRELVYGYFGQKGWQRDRADTAGIIDIGWKGTIQDNLCYLYPEYKIVGFYTGLQPFLSPQPVNADKYGYINSYRLKAGILLTVRPLEMLCNSAGGSVTGYVRKGSKIAAVRKKDAAEDAVYNVYTKKEQEKIIAQMGRHCKRMRAKGRCPSDYKKKAHRALYRFIAYPNRRTVKAYFSLRHNEEFGMGTYVEIRAGFRLGVFIKAFYSRQGRMRLKALLKEASWPQGYLVKYWLYPVLYLYNYLLAGYASNKFGSA